MIKRLLGWIGKSIFFLVLFLTLAYWTVPYATKKLYDTHAIEAKLKTVIIPSDQPKTVSLPSKEKKILRASHLDTYLGTAAHTLWNLPALSYRYLTIQPQYRPIEKGAIGIFVDPAKNNPETILDALKELPISSVGLRIYMTPEYLASDAYRQQLTMAKILHQKGYNLLLVLAQLHESFDGKLRQTISKVVKEFAPYADYYQIAEAINRTKWGMRDRHNYLRFVETSFDAIHTFDPTAKTLGPSVIDFEWFYALYYNDLAKHRFDIANTLLYVDRVREPENEQHGFDTIEKIRLFKAIEPDKPLWITEVNWPIKDQGEYMPTSKSTAVSESHYRDYMARYLIMALGSGFVQRVYWWQLFAKGYGLIDHLSLRKREAFGTFGALVRLLEGSTPLPSSHTSGLYHYPFQKSGHVLHFFWTKDGEHKKLPERYRCQSLEGKAIDHAEAGPTPLVCEEAS